MHVLKRGFTLHEMLIALSVLGALIGLVTHFAVAQLRLLTGVTEAAALRSQLGQATDVVAATLWGLSPASGDLLVAQDSAVEIRMPIGTAVVCGGGPGQVVIPRPSAVRGNTLSAFVKAPDAGDGMTALFSDSTGITWLSLRVLAPPQPSGPCSALLPESTWTVATMEPLALRQGTVVRFSRPLRLSLYRASDGRWFLGARDWNAALSQFNGIQPVAGPLRAHSQEAGATGLHFEYRNRSGVALAPPVDPREVSSITIVARGRTGRSVASSYEDSVVAAVALPNAR